MSAADSTRRNSQVFRDALIAYSQMSDVELQGHRNALHYEWDDCTDLDSASEEVCRNLVGDWLAAADTVLRRRSLRSRAFDSPRWEEWKELSDRIRRDADIVAIFAAAGWPLVRQGLEFGGPCFACGGTDRLRVFPAPDERHDHPRAWCRRCGGYWDAIGCLRNVSAEAMNFGYFDAVAMLAESLGMNVPSELKAHKVPTSRRPRHAGFVEFVGGKAVPR